MHLFYFALLFLHFLCVPDPWANALLSLATLALIWPVPHPTLQLLLLALVQHSQQQVFAAFRTEGLDSRIQVPTKGLGPWTTRSPSQTHLHHLDSDMIHRALGPHPLLVDQEHSLAVSYTDKHTFNIGPTDKGKRMSTHSLIYECSEQLLKEKNNSNSNLERTQKISSRN